MLMIPGSKRSSIVAAVLLVLAASQTPEEGTSPEASASPLRPVTDASHASRGEYLEWLAWFEALSEVEQDEVAALVGLLEAKGPHLPFPYSSGVRPPAIRTCES